LEKIGFRKKIDKPKSKDNQLKIGQFRLGKKLGSGRFGNVYIA
jgi:hypothetical protein